MASTQHHPIIINVVVYFTIQKRVDKKSNESEKIQTEMRPRAEKNWATMPRRYERK